ncbi:Integrin alpha beta-propellor repeat containing protein [Gracilaria domingensis]|nr:Integrin alpha beta-propellor repeat containing protein [Gracilaria domingensis]
MLYVIASFLLLSFCPLASAGGLFLQPPAEDRSSKLKFGQSICISRDGMRVLVGANGYDRYRGALYIYDLVTAPGDHASHWQRTTLSANGTERAEDKKPHELRVLPRGSAFGFSCSMSADARRLVIGAPGHDTQRGAVFVFAYSPSQSKWVEVERLNTHDARPGDSFGWAVVVNHDCTVLATSARGKKANNGEVFAYDCERGCTKCELISRINAPDYTDTTGPRGIRIRNNFGTSMSMNAEGDVLVVSSIGYDDERGAVYIFRRAARGEEWKLAQRVVSPKAQQRGYFGYRLAMDHDANHIVIGADGEDEYTGAVYVFHKNSHEYEFVYEINAEEAEEEDNFGASLAMSGNGRTLIIGAPGANRGRVKDHGVVYVYEKVKGEKTDGWQLAKTVSLPVEHWSEGNYFGWNVDISANGRKYVSSAPESYGGSGLVAFGDFEVSGRSMMNSASLIHDEIVNVGKEEL